jgi:phage terminase large subunit-like protein
VLNDLRARALTKDSNRIGWYEWSATPGSQINDRYAWQQANPALGYLINEQVIEDAAMFDNPDAFKTERLCMWVDAIDSPWPMDNWNDAEETISMQAGLPTWMALDMVFDRTRAYLVTVQQRADNKFNVFMHEWVKDNAINDVELAGEIATIARDYYPRALAYDPNTSGYIAPHLSRAGLPVSPTPWSSATFAIMCDQTLNAMTAGDLKHPGQPTLHSHLVSCARRPASDGGWRIARRAASVPISAAVALVMAVGHATTPQTVPVIVSV